MDFGGISPKFKSKTEMISIFGKSPVEMMADGHTFTVSYKDGKPNYVEVKPPTPPNAKRIKYDLNEAFEWGAGAIHPQRVVENCGCYVYEYEADSMADFVIMVVDKLPDEMPSWIEETTETLKDLGEDHVKLSAGFIKQQGAVCGLDIFTNEKDRPEQWANAPKFLTDYVNGRKAKQK